MHGNEYCWLCFIIRLQQKKKLTLFMKTYKMNCFLKQWKNFQKYLLKMFWMRYLASYKGQAKYISFKSYHFLKISTMTDKICEVKRFVNKIKYILGIGIKTNSFMNFKEI